MTTTEQNTKPPVKLTYPADKPTGEPGGGLKAGPLLRVCVWLAVIGVCLVFLVVAAFAIPPIVTSIYAAFAGSSPEFASLSEEVSPNPQMVNLFTWVWFPSHNQFGLLPMLCGSIILSISALLLAWPLALGLCCKSLSLGNSPGAAFLRGTIAFMTAIPTVVYGFASVFLLVPLMRNSLGYGSGLCWLSGSLVLALLITPGMVLVMDAGLRSPYETIRLNATALGFNRMQTISLFVLPATRTPLCAAAVLGFARGMGDTIIALMLTGNAPQLPQSLGESLRTLTAHMSLVTATEVGGPAYNSLFVAGGMLLLVSALSSLGLRRLGRPGQREQPDKPNDTSSKSCRSGQLKEAKRLNRVNLENQASGSKDAKEGVSGKVDE